MPFATPKWHALLHDVPVIPTAKIRGDLSATIRIVEQNQTRLVLSTYKAPRAGLVPLFDLVVLQTLDQHPELMAQVKDLIQQEGDDGS